MPKTLFIIFSLFLGGIVLFCFPASGYCVTSTVDISVSAEVTSEEPPSPPGGGGGGVVPPSPPANVIFKGRAYPNAALTIFKDEVVAATFFAESSGLFEKELTGVRGGVYNFGISAEDNREIKSVTLGFTASILGGRTTTISGIFISPTISLVPTQVEKGHLVNIFGQSFPESQVKIFVASAEEIVKESISDQEGNWDYKLNTALLREGEHEARAKALFQDGEQTSFSHILPFLVLAPGTLVCKGADLNFDGKINLIDFSILLYFWGQSSPSNRCVDINFDNMVDLVDFSIMMYWWTA